MQCVVVFFYDRPTKKAFFKRVQSGGDMWQLFWWIERTPSTSTINCTLKFLSPDGVVGNLNASNKRISNHFEFLKLNLPLPFIPLCLWTFSFPMCVCGKLLSITVRWQAIIFWNTIITPQQYWMRMYLDFLLLDPFLRLFQQPKDSTHLQRWSNPI